MLQAKCSGQPKFVPIIAHCNTQRSVGGGLDLHISEEQSASRFWMPSDLVKPSQKFTSAVALEHMRVHSPQHIRPCRTESGFEIRQIPSIGSILR
jgi:hypothetical protein